MIKGVPKGLRRKVKETFVAALMTSPGLANDRVFKKWITWDSERRDVSPPTVFPAIQVLMLGGPVERQASTRMPGQPMTYVNKSIFTVVIGIWAAGTDAGDVCDLADLVYAALDPRDPDARAALQARFKDAGIKDWQLSREILPASAEAFALESCLGTGAYQTDGLHQLLKSNS